MEDEKQIEILSDEIDETFDKVKSFTYDTSYTAKEIIIASNKWGKPTAEYIEAVQGWIEIFNEAHKNLIKRGQKE